MIWEVETSSGRFRFGAFLLAPALCLGGNHYEIVDVGYLALLDDHGAAKVFDLDHGCLGDNFKGKVRLNRVNNKRSSRLW